MRLPAAWIDKIFEKLTVRYGRDFLGRWEGVPIADVKEDWADCLGGFTAKPSALAWALDNLPDSKAPTVQDFRAICYRSPEISVPALPQPPQDPAVVAMVVKGIKANTKEMPHGMKEWAYRLQARHEQGDRISPYQIACYMAALGIVKPELEAA